MHRCSKCGAEFYPDEPRGAIQELLGRRNSYVRLDDYIRLKCPNCGHTELATERRFFGFLGPSGLTRTVTAIVFGVLIFVCYYLWRELS